MSTTGANADPLAALGSLPGVAESVESVRKSVDRVYGHRVMRRRSNEITSEAALRGARGSAALSGADWALGEVRRRTDFRGELFPGSAQLLGWADNLVEIKTICHCGRKATMVVRVDEHGRAVTDGPQVQIGGNERYVSVSRAEFKKIVRGEGRIELQQPELPLG